MRASGWLRLSAVILSLAVAAARAPAQQTALGLFHGQTDVGQVTKRGSVTYDAVRERYTIAGSGANMWFDRRLSLRVEAHPGEFPLARAGAVRRARGNS